MDDGHSTGAVADVVAWWGEGPPPHERWPGVTIPIDDGGGTYRFDAALAGRVCEWFPRFCSHSKGESAGKRFDLLPYQSQLLLRPLFGWVRADGTRRFRKAYIEIPKKNGKTQLIAGLALYMLLADNEPGAEVYVAAADREQARILFAAASAMVESNPSLSKRLQIYRNKIERKDDKTAFFQVLSAEAATKHGPNIHCLIIDELHAQPDRDLFETLTRGVLARRQPLILLITTAGNDDESICYEERDYAKRVLERQIEDPHHLPVIFEADPDEDWRSRDVWRRVNPGLGFTIAEDAFAAFALEAQHEPRKLNDFLRFHLNRWVNTATAWIPVDWWDACRESVPSDVDLQRYAVCAGLDLAQKFDLAGLILAFRVPIADIVTVEAIATETGGAATLKSLNLNYRIVLVPFFWIPEDTMREHELRDGLPYSDWQRAGLVTATEGRTIDYSRIYRDITETILPRFPRLKQGKIGYDPAFATDIATQLRDRAGLQVEEVLQNYTHLSEVSYVFEALVKAGRVAHGGHRVLRNHLQNVAIKSDDARRIRPVKPKQQSKRIDGVVGTLMGLKMLATVPDEPVEAFSFFMLGGGHGSTATR